MANSDIYSLDQSEELAQATPARLGGAFFANLALRVEDALLGTRKELLRELSERLAQLLDAQIRQATPDAKAPALGDASASEALLEAYSLGQLGFAQLLTASASEHTVNDAFECLLRSSLKYVRCLRGREQTNIDIATQLRFEPEVVSRKLRSLRAAGVTDFRRDGRLVYNFLTPAAAEALAELEPESARPDAGEARMVSRATQTFSDRLPEHQTRLQTFGSAKANVHA